MNLCNTTVVLSSGAQICIIALGVPCLAIAILDIIALFSMRLHAKPLYRLVLYKVISEAVFSVTMAGAAIKYEDLPLIYLDAIVIFMATATILLYLWLAMHLFVYAVCYKNLKTLEPLYVASTVLLSVSLSALYIAVIKLVPAPHGCPMNIVMAGALVVLSLLLLLSAAAILSSSMTMIYRSWCKHESPYKRQYRATFKETIPFVVYPTAYVLFLCPLLILSIYHMIPISVLKSTHDFRYSLPQCFCVVGCLTVTVHLVVVRFIQKCERKSSMISTLVAQNGTYGSTIVLSTDAQF